MNAFARVLIATACLGCAATSGLVPIQRAPVTMGIVVRSGWIRPELRDSVLAKQWTTTAGQRERAACITEWTPTARHVIDLVGGDSLLVAIDSQFLVWSAVPARILTAGVASIEFICPRGMPTLHTHPPQTCGSRDPSSCNAGGWQAYQCQPSAGDLRALLKNGAPFSVIQCGPREFRFYWPSELVGSTFRPERTRELRTARVP